MRHRFPPVSGLGLALCMCVGAHATVVESLTLAQATEMARTVLHGTCVSKESHWNSNHTYVLTTYQFRVTEWLKGGDGTSAWAVTHLGGLADGVTTEVCGMPRYEVGEELVLFLNAPHPSNGCCMPIGMGQGAYHVSPGKDDRPTVFRSLGGLVLWNPGTGESMLAPSETQGEQVLVEFLAEVRDLLGSSEGK